MSGMVTMVKKQIPGFEMEASLITGLEWQKHMPKNGNGHFRLPNVYSTLL